MTGHEPAFPQPIDDMGMLRSVTEGMSIRVYLAAKAMQGMFANDGLFAALREGRRERMESMSIDAQQMDAIEHRAIAASAVKIADALLAELARKEQA